VPFLILWPYSVHAHCWIRPNPVSPVSPRYAALPLPLPLSLLRQCFFFSACSWSHCNAIVSCDDTLMAACSLQRIETMLYGWLSCFLLSPPLGYWLQCLASRYIGCNLFVSFFAALHSDQGVKHCYCNHINLCPGIIWCIEVTSLLIVCPFVGILIQQHFVAHFDPSSTYPLPG